MTALILESAFRSLMMAAVVWAGIKLLRIHNVLVQKMAWCFVLFSALAMPVLMHWHLLQSKSAVVVPVRQLLPQAAAVIDTPSVAATPAVVAPSLAMMARPSASPAKHWSIAQWKAYVVPVYVVIGIALLLRLILGLVLAARIWHRAEEASVLLDPKANVRISDDVKTPVTIGSTTSPARIVFRVEPAQVARRIGA